MTGTTDLTQVKLRLYYWNVRGRVQSVRYILQEIVHKHPSIDYEENNELLENAAQSWVKNKPDENVAGPFHNLPVLHWNDQHIFGQTLTIGQFLARKFDLYGKLTSTINDVDVLHAYIDGVVSCAYTDVISNVLGCIWNSADFNDENSPSARLIKKISTDLKALNSLLGESKTSFYYDQAEPTIADFFVFEAFTVARDYSKRLTPNENDYQNLFKLEKTIKERPALAQYFNKGLLFKRFTGCPKEPEYMAKLAEMQN